MRKKLFAKKAFHFALVEKYRKQETVETSGAITAEILLEKFQVIAQTVGQNSALTARRYPSLIQLPFFLQCFNGAIGLHIIQGFLYRFKSLGYFFDIASAY